MSADRIAEVVADIRANRVKRPVGVPDVIRDPLLAAAKLAQPVVDCTAIFRMQFATPRIDLYGDNPSITPPWKDALFGFVNSHNNTIVAQVHRDDWDGSTIDNESWNSCNDVDWSRVRWIATSTIWVGGQSGDGRLMPTTGPCYIIRYAIRDDGTPEDINWVELLPTSDCRSVQEAAAGLWDATVVTLTASLNYLNCSNVDIAEPSRPRPERRRIARTGVRVQTIVVRPPGRRRADDGYARPIEAIETPLTSIRGHFAHYGVNGREGLLFGKYRGKFWVPAHARGGAGGGEPEPRAYKLDPGGAT